MSAIWLPGNLSVVTTSSTTATGFTNDQILAAPTAGSRYRVWAWDIVRDRLSYTAVVEGSLYDGTNTLDRLGLGDTEGAIVHNIPGGIVAGNDTALYYRHRDSTAGDTVRVTVHYATEVY